MCVCVRVCGERGGDNSIVALNQNKHCTLISLLKLLQKQLLREILYLHKSQVQLTFHLQASADIIRLVIENGALVQTFNCLAHCQHMKVATSGWVCQ